MLTPPGGQELQRCQFQGTICKTIKENDAAEVKTHEWHGILPAWSGSLMFTRRRLSRKLKTMCSSARIHIQAVRDATRLTTIASVCRKP
jgi:hypothetical protein